MSVFLQPIYTQTVGSGGTIQVTFNNIPQTFTDLMIKVSQRNDTAVVSEPLAINFNADTSTIYSSTSVYGDGSGTGSLRASGYGYISYNGGLSVPGANATANTFGSFEVYIPNYTGSNFKSMTIDAVSENNATSTVAGLGAGLYRSTNPITIIAFRGYNGILIQNSTITIYGITRG